MRAASRTSAFRSCVASLVILAIPALPARALSPMGPAAVAPIDLKFMEFNIEVGGTIVDFHSIVRAIGEADPDVVGVEEAQGSMPRLADATGYPYYSVRLQVLSRFPVIDPPRAKAPYVFVEVSPGAVVAIGNVHLPAGPYSPNLTLRGAKRREVLEIERRVRLPAVEPSVRALAKVVDDGIPAFLTGDFNAPSYRDWTPATVGLRPQITYPVRWPVSAYVEGAGFHDSYRDAHPDPVADPGLTWPSGRPHEPGVWNPGPHAPADRIDFVYAAGDAQTLASETIGESGGPGVSIGVDPWGTDHRSTLSTFRVQPGAEPTLVAVDSRLVAAGDVERIRYNVADGSADRVTVVALGGDPSKPRFTASTGGAPGGTVDVPTDGWRPGTYAVLLERGSDALSSVRFWVEAPGARPRIWTSKSAYRVGRPIRVHWADAPGERWDWVGVYSRGANASTASYLLWFYTHATIQGSGTLDEDSVGPWPLPPGRYSLYLLADDGYRVIARARFTVLG